MRLIKISGVERSVEHGTPAAQQSGCMTRPLDLLIAAERHAGDAAKMALNRTLAHPVDIAFDGCIGCMAARDDAKRAPAEPRKPQRCHRSEFPKSGPKTRTDRWGAPAVEHPDGRSTPPSASVAGRFPGESGRRAIHRSADIRRAILVRLVHEASPPETRAAGSRRVRYCPRPWTGMSRRSCSGCAISARHRASPIHDRQTLETREHPKARGHALSVTKITKFLEIGAEFFASLEACRPSDDRRGDIHRLDLRPVNAVNEVIDGRA